MAVAGIVGPKSVGRTSAQERIQDPAFHVVVELVPDAERTMRLYETAEAVDALLEGNQPTPTYLLSTRITVEALRASFADPSAIDVRRFREQVDWYAELLDDPSTPEGAIYQAQHGLKMLPATAGPDASEARHIGQNQPVPFAHDDGEHAGP